jgi:hypothetical protein
MAYLFGAGESQMIAYTLPAPTGTMLACTAPATVEQELAEAPAPRCYHPQRAPRMNRVAMLQDW